MIYLVTGKPGSGKSYYCVRKVYDVLSSGRYLAGNLELEDGWAQDMARANPFWRPFPKKVARAAERFEERSYFTHSLDELTRLRLPPCGTCDACRRGVPCHREGRGVMLMDEAHNWLNARTWDADEEGRDLSRAEAVANRLKIVRFFSQHRKLGWTIYLITQAEGQLDNQVRRNFEYQVHLKNMRRLKVPLLGIPLFPVNLFVAVTVWHDAQASRVGVETYFLNKRIARLYRTTATSHGLVYDDPDAIWLGRTRAGDASEPKAAAAPPRDTTPGASGPSTDAETRHPRDGQAAAEFRPVSRFALGLDRLRHPHQLAELATGRGSVPPIAEREARVLDDPDSPAGRLELPAVTGAEWASAAVPSPASTPSLDAAVSRPGRQTAAPADDASPPSLAPPVDTSDAPTSMVGATMSYPTRTNAPELATPTRSTSTTDQTRALGSPPG